MWVSKGCLLELGVGTKQQIRKGWLERKGLCIHKNCLLVLEAWILESVVGRNVEEEHLWEPLELWSERKGRWEQVFCYRFKNETWDRHWRIKRRGESLPSAYLLPLQQTWFAFLMMDLWHMRWIPFLLQVLFQFVFPSNFLSVHWILCLYLKLSSYSIQMFAFS